MNSTEKLEIIKMISNSTLVDDEKIYFIQSFLLNWTSKAQIEELLKEAE